MFSYIQSPLDHHRVYLDHNATTPLAAFLEPKIVEWLSLWGNPSSIHQSGRGPKALLRAARSQVADLIGAHPLELVFTSGGSEANNLAIKGVMEALPRLALFRGESPVRRQFLYSGVEHPSVAKTMEYLRSRGFDVGVIPVNRQGEIDLEAYRKMLGPQTALVSVMYANNETGNMFPIKKMAKLAHEVGALFHCDGVQALGKVPVNVKDWGVDLASFSGHKFYSLKGCGVLYVQKGTTLESLIHGGGQERGRRAGTENLLAIAALGAMSAYKDQIIATNERVGGLRDQLQADILASIPNVNVTGGKGRRIPNTLSLVIEGVDGESLLMNLDLKGFSVSTGAACSSGNPEPSPVLLAMGLSREEAQSSLRLSLGWGTQEEDLKAFVKTLSEVVARLRSVRHGEVAHYGV